MAVDVAGVVAELLPPLVAASTATLSWWSESELYGHANRATAGLARASLLSAGKSMITTATAQAAYSLPSRFIGALVLESGGYVRPQSSAAALDALVPAWQIATSTTVERYCLDSDGPTKIRLYPTPESAGTATLLYRDIPADATTGAPTLALPSVLSELIWLSILAAARAKEGKAAMPDVAAAASQAAAVLATAAADIWRVA